jgi:hypothetical protein
MDFRVTKLTLKMQKLLYSEYSTASAMQAHSAAREFTYGILKIFTINSDYSNKQYETFRVLM